MAKGKRDQDILLGLPQLQLHFVAQVSERQGDVEIRQEFGIRLIEARIICMVGSVDTCPFKVLTVYGRFDKGHASRTVSALVGKGLMVSETDTENQRATLLRLTTAGERLNREIIASAVRRNRRWLAVLPADERDGLKRALSTLYRTSAGLVPEEFSKVCSDAAARRPGAVRRPRR